MRVKKNPLPTFYFLLSPRLRRGFTLIEVLVVLSITVLLSAFLLAYTSAGREQVAMHIERSKIIQVISRAKALAIATYNKKGVPCGYGVSVEYDSFPQRYDLYGYKTDDCSSIVDVIKTSDGYSVIESFELREGLGVSASESDSVANVFFVPPDPAVKIWLVGGEEAENGGTIHIKTKSATSEVMVNGVGQITY